MTSPRRNVTEWRYDALSRLTEVEVPVAEDEPDIVTSFGYDEAGNRVRVTDGNGNTTYTSYNPWNLEETVVEPWTVPHPGLGQRCWAISYDAGGLPVGESQPDGVEISRVFDMLGRLTYEAGIDAGVLAERSLGYDLVGRVTSVSHPDGALTYTWDDRGLMLTADDGAGGTTEFSYDELGRMDTRQDPSGDYVFGWTGRSELDTVTDAVTGDPVVDYDWTVASELDTVTYGNSGLTRDYNWNDRGLLESDVLTNGAGSTVASFTYDYDADGNVKLATITKTGDAGIVQDESTESLLARMARSGFPSAFPLGDARPWLRAYIESIAERSVDERRDPDRVLRVLRVLAELEARAVPAERVWESADVNRETLGRYERMLRRTHVITPAAAWTSNRLKRVTSYPKRYFVDPGLAMATCGITATHLLADPMVAGHYFDSFVAAQLRPEVDALGGSMHHLRTKGGAHEIDIVIDLGGKLVAVETKFTTRPTKADAKHLLWFREQYGARVSAAILVHRGRHDYEIAAGVRAMPVHMLWS